MDESRSETPQGPEGQLEGTLQVVGTAKAGPSTQQPARAGSARAEPIQHTQQRGGAAKVELPLFSRGAKAAMSTVASANKHIHGGGAKAPPHTKLPKSVGGRSTAGKPAGQKAPTSTGGAKTGTVPPQGGAKPKAGASPNIPKATGQPATHGLTAGDAAALERFDAAWTLVEPRRNRGKPNKSAGSAGGAGTSQTAGSDPAPPKRKSKKQRQRQKERANAAKAAKRAAAAQTNEPKPKGSVKFAKGKAGGRGNQATSENQSGKTTVQGIAGAGGTNQARAKRVRLDDSQSPKVLPKKQRLEDGSQIPYAEAVRSDLMVAVTTVTGSPLTAQASQELQELLQARLLEEALKMTANTSVEPGFRGKPIFTNGVLKLWCDDHSTLVWLTETVAGLTLSTCSGLVVKRQCDLVRMVRCGVLLPVAEQDIWQMGRVLRYQNKWAKVESWLLHKADRQGGGTFLIFSAPEDVVQSLMDRERRLHYMLGSVYVKFQGPKGKFTEHLPLEREAEEETIDAGQAKESGPGEIPVVPEPPPQTQSTPKSPIVEVVEEWEQFLRSDDGDCTAGLNNLAIGGTESEGTEGLSEDGEPDPTAL